MFLFFFSLRLFSLSLGGGNWEMGGGEWDTARGALLTAGHRLTVWPMRARLAPRAKANRSHRAAVCAALYNPHFGQVVSGDALASVHVWSVETGEASNGVAYQDQFLKLLDK